MKIRYRLSWLLLVLSLTVTVWAGWHWQHLTSINATLAKLNDGQKVSLNRIIDAHPEIRLAHAHHLADKKRYRDALSVLDRLFGLGDESFQARVRYNLGNVYLRQAVTATEDGRFDQAMSFAELAKQALRQALALQPDFWDAKYNLEVAIRLLPDMQRISAQREEDDQQPAISRVTTIPGIPRGLP
ncbi:MAG: tetratricopeptide repeat protein [Methylococcales bacterium]|nr:tetratricopeptide repeat protein [Methylococcales bacterium]